MNQIYPKILVIDETFHHKSGGGITLCNLFNDWPREKLLNASDTYILDKRDVDKCESYYQFGNMENRYFLPWCIRRFIPHPILNNNAKSGARSFYIKEETLFFKTMNRRCIFKSVLKEIAIKVSYITGIYPLLCKRKVSDEFLQWVDLYKPDYIYTQLSDITNIRFIEELTRKVNIPLVIHVMDDWPVTYSRPGLLYYYWKKRIDIEFRELIKRAKICLSISDGMSEEYKKRYDRTFLPFHNPIDKNLWLEKTKMDFSINESDIRVLYSGRIGLGTSDALLQIIKAIHKLRKEGVKITLELQVPQSNHDLYGRYVNNGTVVFNQVVSYEEIPGVFSRADILILPYDFSSNGIKFIKYSMPTKASEFMMSGTPILLYCNENVFLCKYAKKYKWAHVVTNKGTDELKNELILLVKNEYMRISYSRNAFLFALEHFDMEKVRERFLNVFLTA